MSSSIPQAFKSLHITSAESKSDHEHIFEVSYEYLSKIKNFEDVKSFHNCIVALINMDKYHKANILLKEVPKEVSDQLPVEKIYIYYKLGLSSKLNEVYENLSNDINEIELRAIKHILAQHSYQKGDIFKALSLYHELITNNQKIDNELDLACNERAVISQITNHDKFNETSKILSTITDENSYDLLFNNSLIELSKGNLEKSLELLNIATDKCTSANIDSDPQDLLMELAPMKLTIAYIYQLQGNISRAKSMLDDDELKNVNDLMINLIIKNNYHSLNKSSEINLIHRDLDYQYNLHHLEQKLIKSQHQTLLQNHLLLSYQSSTISKNSSYLSNASIERYLKSFPGDFTPIIYKVLLALQIDINDLINIDYNKAISRKLFKYISNKVENDDLKITAAFLLNSVNSKSGHYDQSIYVFEKMTNELINESRLIPSVIGSLINLYETLNHSSKLNELILSLIEKFESIPQNEIFDNFDLYNLIKVIGFKLINLNDEENANKVFQILKSTGKEDLLIDSISSKDSSKLLPVNSLASSTDVETLLETNIDSLITKPTTSKSIPVSKTDKEKPNKISKKTKKPKFSKHKFYKPDSEFNPEKELDSERWLPLKVRSYYKPSKKDKKRSGGHQGIVDNSQSQPQPQSSSASKSNANKKKKKKGKK